MEFEEKWKNRIKASKNDDRDYVTKSLDTKLLQKHVRSHLIQRNVNLGLHELVTKNLDASKIRFSIAAMLSEYCFIKYNNNWPYWNMKPYAYALLSDHTALIDRFAYLPVDEHIIYDNPKDGIPAGFNYAFQGLLQDDDLLIERGLNHFLDKVEKRKEIGLHKAHIACTEAIAKRDEKQVREAIHLFEQKRMKSVFLGADICENIISFFPMAYAKIAWLKGIEVDPESDYMPVELLEVKPLKEYTIPYWFLRDYYREEGVDWRYDPIHPELQNWENDPENPDQNKGGFLGNLMNLFG